MGSPYRETLTSMTGNFMHAKGWFPSSVVGPGVVGPVATLGTVAAGVAIVEAALIPGLLIGAAAVLVPRLLRRDVSSGLGGGLWRAAPFWCRCHPRQERIQ